MVHVVVIPGQVAGGCYYDLMTMKSVYVAVKKRQPITEWNLWR